MRSMLITNKVASEEKLNSTFWILIFRFASACSMTANKTERFKVLRKNHHAWTQHNKKQLVREAPRQRQVAVVLFCHRCWPMLAVRHHLCGAPVGFHEFYLRNGHTQRLMRVVLGFLKGECSKSHFGSFGSRVVHLLLEYVGMSSGHYNCGCIFSGTVL